jgi:serine/threonine protein kinase
MELNTVRIPFHPNVARIVHHFVGTLPPGLPGWDLDPGISLSSSLVFIVMELLSFSLQQVISFRLRAAGEEDKDEEWASFVSSSIFTHVTNDHEEVNDGKVQVAQPTGTTVVCGNDEEPNWMVLLPGEILVVIRDISNALCHLHRHRIAHLDLKPDNILFRLSSSVTRDSAMKNLCQHGVTAVLSDLGWLASRLSM